MSDLLNALAIGMSLTALAIALFPNAAASGWSTLHHRQHERNGAWYSNCRGCVRRTLGRP